MKGGMKKAFTALLAATVLVGGMPVNIILRDGRLTCADGGGNIWNMDIDGVQPDIKIL